MGNKEIIIDGVDVSGCEYYNKYDKTCREVNGNYDTDICEFDKCENSNCCYKQLKTKKQENEELKKELEAVYDDCKGCPTCNEALYNANLYAKECRELKQTLAEIKEIAERISLPMGTGKSGNRVFLAKQILQKISEVEDEN